LTAGGKRRGKEAFITTVKVRKVHQHIGAMTRGRGVEKEKNILVHQSLVARRRWGGNTKSVRTILQQCDQEKGRGKNGKREAVPPENVKRGQFDAIDLGAEEDEKRRRERQRVLILRKKGGRKKEIRMTRWRRSSSASTPLKGKKKKGGLLSSK